MKTFKRRTDHRVVGIPELNQVISRTYSDSDWVDCVAGSPATLATLKSRFDDLLDREIRAEERSRLLDLSEICSWLDHHYETDDLPIVPGCRIVDRDGKSAVVTFANGQAAHVVPDLQAEQTVCLPLAELRRVSGAPNWRKIR